MLVTEVTILRLTLMALGIVLVVVAAGLIAVRYGSPGQVRLAVALPGVAVICAAMAVAARFEGNMTAQRAAEAAMFAAIAIILAAAGHTDVAATGAETAAGAYTTMLLQFSVLIAAYGVLIPNTPLRALGISALLAVPALLILVFAAELVPIARVVGPLIALVLAVAVSGVAAFLIHAFRKLAVETRILNMYDLTERIGEGGMGEVWRAEHRRLARTAAIKLIRKELLSDDVERSERVMARFELEAKATANLRSPNTVEVYDFGTAGDDTFFYVMEYLDGFDLETMVEDCGPLQASRVVYLLRQVCESIGDAHENGLVHRDIKPANISVSRMGLAYDYVKVLDFGLVKPMAADDSVVSSAESVVTGTPAYMAPEMVTGDAEVDERVDIYAIGCVAYWMLTGCLVFDEANPMKMAVAHATYPPVEPSKRTEMAIPRSIEQIVLRCLEKAPEDRFQTVRDVSAALAECDVDDEWTPEAAEDWWRRSKPAESVLR